MQIKIGIFGDSWSCGEWSRINKNYEITHTGLNYYLNKAGYDCKSYGLPGGGNLRSFNKLKENEKNIDIVIFVLTQPFRDFYDQLLKYDSNKSFNKNCEFAIKNIISNLSQQKLKNKIILVNGLFELEKQSGFIRHISWCKLLKNNFIWPKHYAHPGHINDAWLKKKILHIDKQSVLQDIDQDTKNFDLFISNMQSNKDYFYPDGSHPNRKGHKVLSEEIIKILNEY